MSRDVRLRVGKELDRERAEIEKRGPKRRRRGEKGKEGDVSQFRIYTSTVPGDAEIFVSCYFFPLCSGYGSSSMPNRVLFYVMYVSDRIIFFLWLPSQLFNSMELVMSAVETSCQPASFHHLVLHTTSNLIESYCGSTGSTFQIISAYSWIQRSLLKNPILATLIIHLLTHSS